MSGNTIFQAFDSLPQELRQVLVLATVEELDYATLAARLGIDVATVEERLAQALVHLDRQMG